MYNHIFTRKKLLTKKLKSIEIEQDRRDSTYRNQVEMEVRGIGKCVTPQGGSLA